MFDSRPSSSPSHHIFSVSLLLLVVSILVFLSVAVHNTQCAIDTSLPSSTSPLSPGSDPNEVISLSSESSLWERVHTRLRERFSDEHGAETQDAVSFFQSYIRVDTRHPSPNYEPAVALLLSRAQHEGLDAQRIEIHPGHPAVVVTLAGRDPSLPSVGFQSHMDVVPCVEEKWTYGCTSAHIDEQGRIFGRGTQDMKCVTAAQLLALGRFSRSGNKPLRTIHLLFVPDEEIGGERTCHGVVEFVHQEAFQKLNLGVVIDEGLADPSHELPLYYGERTVWWLVANAEGPPSHGAMLTPNTAFSKIMKFANGMLEWRAEEVSKLGTPHPETRLPRIIGDVTTINLSYMKGGVTKDGIKYQINVLPSEVECGFDMRVMPLENFTAVHERIRQLAEAANVTTKFVSYLPNPSVSPRTSVWYRALERSLLNAGVSFFPAIFPAATDSRFVRARGIPAYGFSPMPFTPIRLHDHDEYLHRDIFLYGITVYEQLFMDISSVPGSE